MQDYKSKHINWANEHKHSFIPYGMASIAGTEYVKLLDVMYSGACGTYQLSQEHAKLLYNGDRKHYAEMKGIPFVDCDAEDNLNSETFIVSVMVGFIKTNENYSQMEKFVRRILQSSWVESGSAVLEFTGEDGYRPHTHLALQVKKTKTYKHPSNIGDAIWKILKGQNFRGMVGGREHINYDYGHSNTDEYIKGNKCDAKQDFVAQDRIFRDTHGIPHIFNK